MENSRDVELVLEEKRQTIRRRKSGLHHSWKDFGGLDNLKETGYCGAAVHLVEGRGIWSASLVWFDVGDSGNYVSHRESDHTTGTYPCSAWMLDGYLVAW